MDKLKLNPACRQCMYLTFVYKQSYQNNPDPSGQYVRENIVMIGCAHEDVCKEMREETGDKKNDNT